MKRAATKIIPKLLNFEQKQRRNGYCWGEVDYVQRLYRFVKKKLITDDKTWVYGYDIQTKAQSS